jgi:hypothetical protein
LAGIPPALTFTGKVAVMFLLARFSRYRLLLFLSSYVFVQSIAAQTVQQKEVKQQVQTWVSINSIYRFSERWGAMADIHIRRNDFVQDPSFYFLRLGADYWIQEHLTVAGGYGHTWFAPPRENWKTWTEENRLYQQIVYVIPGGKTGLTHRIRNEQRWVQISENDRLTGKVRFVNRIRYLASLNFRLSGKPGAPSLVLADEIMVHFGKDVVYNTFDQNRLFVGINKKINRHFSFDFGYMNVYQQKFTGYQYDMNHTIRLFFYYLGGWKKETHQATHQGHDE